MGHFWRAPKSNVLTLWGMADLNSSVTDVYTLSLTYVPSKDSTGKTNLGLASKSRDKWVNAVDKNKGGAKKNVEGPSRVMSWAHTVSMPKRAQPGPSSTTRVILPSPA